MALRKIAVKGSGLTQLRSVRTTSDGSSLTETQTWTGEYALLKIKQDAVQFRAKATNLEPTEADHGKLTITLELQLPAESSNQASESYTEVLWQELRQPLGTAPGFEGLTTAEKLAIQKAVESGAANPTDPMPGDPEMAERYYNNLARGDNEWSRGVPLVRRTTTRVRGDLAGGNAWYRDTPPVDVDGDWEWMKTADDRRRDGKSFTRTEEWTGANEWDADRYPLPVPPP